MKGRSPKAKNNKVGSYTINVIDFNSWINDDPIIVPKNKKAKNKKKVIYPIFMELNQVVTDPFWNKKFNLWAHGKIPKFFTVTQPDVSLTIPTTINYKKMSHEASYVYNPLITLNENAASCIQFFKTFGGFYSKTDEYNSSKDDKDDIDESFEAVILTQWTQFDKKAQELMVKEYVNGMVKLLSLSHKESQLLLQTIRLAFSAKTFNKNNIKIEHNTSYKLIDINGLLWDAEKRLFKIEYTLSKKESDDHDIEDADLAKDSVTQYQSKINKYYEMYEKKYKKYAK